MVKILLKTSISGRYDGQPINWSSGQEVEVDDDYARRLVESGQAAMVTTPAVKVAKKPSAKSAKSVKAKQ